MNTKYTHVTMDWLREALLVATNKSEVDYVKELLKEIEFRAGNENYNFLNFDEQVELLFEEDFLNRVVTVFNNVGYHWATINEGEIDYFIPSKDMINETIMGLLKTVWDAPEELDEDIRTASTGRFEVTRRIYNGVKSLNIDLIVETSHLDSLMVLRKFQ